MPRPARLSSVLVAFLVTLLALGGAGSIVAQEASPLVAAEALAWTACDDGAAGWECASLPVPVDEADANGPTIDLVLTRLPASDPTHRIGPLVLNFGGPGGPAVSTLHEVGAVLFPDEVRARFDLVGFDPRGVGASAPLDCRVDLDASLALDPSPDDAAEWQAWLAGGRDFAAACAANGGPLLPFMGTENVVRDLERLRSALGEETISFLGFSYGTSIGSRYANRYPERVRAFALDAALPPSIDGATLVPQWVAGYEQSFNAFLADCAAALTCPFSSGGDPGAAFDTLMTQLDAAPLAVATDGGSRPVGQSAVLAAVDGTLWDPPRWPNLAAALAAAADGDGTPVLALADRRNDREPDGTYGPSASAFAAVACLDYPFPTDPAAFAALAAKAAMLAPRTGAYNATLVLPCAFWPVPPTPAPDAPVGRGAPPILVVGATVDTQDPYLWAVDMAAQLESGVLLTREGTGHVSYFHSACAYRAINAYLLDLTLPPRGLICPSTGGLFE